MMRNIRQIWTKRMLAAAVALTLSAAAGGVSMAEAAETAVGEAAVTPTATDAVSTAVLAEAAADAVVPPEIIAPVAAPIQEVTGIAKTYGDGAFVDWAVVRYAATINPTSVTPGDFSVAGQTIDDVRVGTTAEVPETSSVGRYVFLKLHHENTAKDGVLRGGPKREAAPPTATPSMPTDTAATTMSSHDAQPAGEEPGMGIMRADRTVPDLSFTVRQVGTLFTADGRTYAPSTQAVAAARVVNPVLSAFTQQVYDDEALAASMPYNLFLPAGYDGTQLYPLVIFIPDASANINDVTTPLLQGNGATVFADPSWQKDHPCIVLALQYTDDLVTQLGMMTTDKNEWTQGLELAWNTIQHVAQTYAVDPNRIYGTGQSQGGMANIAFADRHPDFFAARYLVACQWKTDEMAALKDSHLWITVCDGDTKAYPGMNEATALWKSLGTQVTQNIDPWNNKAPITVLNRAVRKQAAQGAPINYTVFADGNHMYTWSFAYHIDAIREWMFQQENRKS